MPSKVSKDGDLQAPRDGRRESAYLSNRVSKNYIRDQSPLPPASQEPSPAQSGSAYRLTSRCFSLNTRFFTLDLSWRRVEMKAASAPSVPSTARAPRVHPTPDFDEVLRRLKLYALLEPPPCQPETGEAKVSPANPLSAPNKITA